MFDHTNTIQNPWNYEIKIDHLVLARRPDLVIVIKKEKRKERKNRTCWIVDFAVLVDHRVKIKEIEKRDKYLNVARELKNHGTRRCNDITCCWFARNNPLKLGKGTRRFEIRGIGEQSDYIIIKIGQNIEYIPGDLTRFAITQTLVKDYQLMLV